MSEEVDRNDPELKYLSVERNQYNDPATQAEWTQKRLVWVPHENQVSSTEEPLPTYSSCIFAHSFLC
ncbi:myosin heavy chain, non-muscle-like [Drosophila miranda]|uniref:myosin heavy chain, non-muscle-like n=1 Tax=Drosophila miranda TaxID=7229 RepID=UPI00143F60A2|nr:myosin heavy chain, non-muscle-like [Drosophila miranda]